MKFPGYFLIVSGTHQARQVQGHPGRARPRRRRGLARRLCALTIIDLDPLRFSLLFERFLNPERILDARTSTSISARTGAMRSSAMSRRSTVPDRVAQIITFGSLQARGVMRDVGRVLEMSYGQLDKLSNT